MAKPGTPLRIAYDLQYVGRVFKQAKRRVMWKFAFAGDGDEHSVVLMHTCVAAARRTGRGTGVDRRRSSARAGVWRVPRATARARGPTTRLSLDNPRPPAATPQQPSPPRAASTAASASCF